jgi:hypothetical protein
MLCEKKHCKRWVGVNDNIGVDNSIKYLNTLIDLGQLLTCTPVAADDASAVSSRARARSSPSASSSAVRWSRIPTSWLFRMPTRNENALRVSHGQAVEIPTLTNGI